VFEEQSCCRPAKCAQSIKHAFILIESRLRSVWPIRHTYPQILQPSEKHVDGHKKEPRAVEAPGVCRGLLPQLVALLLGRRGMGAARMEPFTRC
jgi:hypothetical protein